MFKKSLKFSVFLFILITLLIQPNFIQTAEAGKGQNKFVQRIGPNLMLNDKPFRFAGSNNYYLMYKSHFMVDDVLDTAVANNFRVMRVWGSLEIGNQDGSNSIDGKKEGVYFQYWDGNKPAYNDGADGLERLDYVIYKAGLVGVKLVIPLVNNWNAFGGIDQYVRWANGQYHDQFFSDATIRGWFKDWIAHLLNRVNIYTGIQYKDDPTIMTWELANEPRCVGGGVYPRSPTCNTQMLIDWADEISRFIKKIDPKHLVSVGDEGFYCIPGASDWTENCNEGVDTIAFTKLPKIDVMSFHLYPDHWGKSAEWGTQWIQRHLHDARMLRKPAMLGEYGWLDKSTRNPVFRQWTDTVFLMRGSGALYWILSGKEDNGAYYPDYDGFTVYCPSPVCITIKNFSHLMSLHHPKTFPPVADNDTALTEFGTSITLAPLSNDIIYFPARSLLINSIDLDPAMDGQQIEVTVYGGTFTWQVDGTVLFVPTAGFSGKAKASYTVQDNLGRLSNQADLLVTVKPSPQAPVILYSFETGTEGWAGGNWQTDPGTTEQSSFYHTDGNYGLKVLSNNAWFTGYLSPSFNMTGKTKLKYDLKTMSSGTSISVAIQFGDSWTWCQSPWGWVNSGTETAVEIDLTSLGCSGADFSKAQAINIWFSTGEFYIDAIRIE